MRHKVNSLVQYLLRDEASSGKFLLGAALIALICTNTFFSASYEHFWQQRLSLSFNGWTFTETLHGVINEGLMAIFFLVAGLEIKREIVRGQLRTLRAALLPIVAAIGGMLVPAFIYMIINTETSTYRGWGIPMATDIAFAVGVVALLGNRVPASLKLFLLTLAVVDDIGAIIVIATFLTDKVNLLPLLGAGTILAAIGALQYFKLLRFRLFVSLGILLWLAFYFSGVHASIAGALLGLSAPIAARTRNNPRQAIAERLERSLIPVSAFIVIPLFALSNAGVKLSLHAFQEPDTLFMASGIMAGLIAGKVIGILGASWLVVQFSSIRLPADLHWRHIFGVGMLGGIGFTLSLFIAELSFKQGAYLEAAKLSIFGASVVSGILGLGYLYFYGQAVTSQAKNS